MDLSTFQLDRLREDPDLGLFRAHRSFEADPVLVVLTTSRAPAMHLVRRLEREFELRADLDPQWALRPIALERLDNRVALLLEDPGGRSLEATIGRPHTLTSFLRTAIELSAALKHSHARGLVHADIRPGNIFVDHAGHFHLTGFGMASRVSRERQTFRPDEITPSSLAYMAPERSGRVNRSVDSRSDLYALGVTLYEMLVGALPFTANQPSEWIYSHVARRPPPPSLRVEGVPSIVDEIILKLLAKNVEDRYQTAAGVEHDLRRCLGGTQPPAPFELGDHDVPSRLVLPERLYGRDSETTVLADAFRNVAGHGSSDFILVSGDPGVGKSSVIGELQSDVYAAGGLFAAGKFDRYKRHIPYATLVEAFRQLFRQILSQEDASLAKWRTALDEALGANGQLIVDLFPEVGVIVGKRPPLPSVSPQEAKNRFQLVFRKFITVFAQAEHPLVLVLDDLQWLDDATLELLEELAGGEQIPFLLILGTFRRGDVTPSHPLSRSLEVIAKARGEVREIRLEPLRVADAVDLISDALHSRDDDIGALAEIVHEKTGGNPFFLVQFLANLDAERLIRFDETSRRWAWDLAQVRLQASTDNVAVLMAAKLKRLRGEARRAITQMACVGYSASTALLAQLLGCSEDGVRHAVRDLVGWGLLTQVDQGFVFAHDGVRDAAYALVPKKDRPALHLRIGDLLRASMSDSELDENIFDVVGHFNQALPEQGSATERHQAATLNLRAGIKAKSAAAYGSALIYLGTGLALLENASWSKRYQLLFDLSLNMADCEFMSGAVDAAEQRLTDLAPKSRNLSDLSLVVGRQIGLYVYLRRPQHAIELSVACLARLGVDLPIEPTEDQVRAEYEMMMEKIGDRPIEDIALLPRMTDPRCLTAMVALANLFSPAGEANANLHHLAALRMANLSLDHGNAEETAHGLACVAGLVLGWRFGTFAQAHALGQLAVRLVVECGFDVYAPKVYAIISGTVGPWSRPLSECYAMAILATDLGREQGGTTYFGYAWGCAVTAMLDSGRVLAEVDQQASHSLAILGSMKFALVAEFVTAQLMMVRALRGMTRSLHSMSDGDFDEAAFVESLEASPTQWHSLVRYRIRRLQLHVLAGDIAGAMTLVALLHHEVGTLKVFEAAEYQFYAALALAGTMSAGTPRDARHWSDLQEAADKLDGWADLCPENFADRSRLVAAEMARVEGRELEAEHLYETAMQLSRRHGFLQNEALANELAARFHASRGFAVIAEAYLRNARACYARWGAVAKVAQIDSVVLTSSNAQPHGEPPVAAASARLQHLDLVAALDVHQALSQEIVLDRLIERLMTIVVEHAGAVRGLLLLLQDGRLRIVAEAAIDQDTVTVSPRKPAHFSGELPQSVLNYVTRTHEVIIIDDALEPNAHSGDPYVLRARPRSILCMPLVKQARLVGVLYLENDLASHAFTRKHVAFLEFVAAQAAISIENAELFHDVQRKQEAVRQAGSELRLSLDMMPALAWSASSDGNLKFSNKRWHDYTGITDHAAYGRSWLQAFHPDDLDKVTEKWKRLRRFRTSGEFEARMRRSDGVFRRFLVRLTPMRDDKGEVLNWHGTNTDIDDIKRAEEAQEALAHASRLTALGELTVSIAHEVNQPLMAIVTNAATCVRWLDAPRANIAEARLAAERIIRDGHRAGDVIASIRAMARKKSARELGPLRIEEVILEVLQLTKNELDRYGIVSDTDFADDAGHVIGDRVQMQQVILNLVLNAIEAMVSGGPNRVLRISTSPGELGFLKVSVADTGKGLAAGAAERIFDAFFTTKTDGLGIGLSICRNIIESHGGRFWVNDNQPRGSVFSFSVPNFVVEVQVERRL